MGGPELKAHRRATQRQRGRLPARRRRGSCSLTLPPSSTSTPRRLRLLSVRRGAGAAGPQSEA
eukprot:5753840-Alexandrium_andersonii.AAC.1